MKLLTPAEVARMLRKSEHTLANWRAIGKGPRYANIGGIVYRERDVEEWLESFIRRTDDAPQKAHRDLALPILGGRPRVHGQYGRGRLGGHRTQQDRRSQSGAQQSRRSRGREQGSGTSEERTSAGAQTPRKPFSEAVTSFLESADGEHADKPNTAKRLHTSFASLSRFFGKSPVSAILTGHVNDFKAWRRKEHAVQEVTIRHDLHALSKAYGNFIDHNWARENPVDGVDIPSDKDAVRMYILSREEEERYFADARRHSALYDLGRLMLNQGTRPEEVLELRVDDVDLERSRLTIRKGKSNAARRTLKLTAESREICARRVMMANSP